MKYLKTYENLNNQKKIIFLDLDGVIVVGWNTSKQYLWGDQEKFDQKCVNVLNDIIRQTDAEIVLSSDWRHHFTLEQLDQMFKYFGVIKSPIDTTKTSPLYTANDLEGGRVEEIKMYIDEHNDEIEQWVVVDDLNMVDLEPNFVNCPKWVEGIKQSGIKQKIINILNER